MPTFDPRKQRVNNQINIAGNASFGSGPNSVLQPTPSYTGTEPSHRLFLSYSHKDKKWLEELLTHLKPMLRNETLQQWNDTLILAGAMWSDEIENALNAADAGVLLVTPEFLASDAILKRELPTLLAKKILWIPVRPSAYEQTPLQHFQALHDPARPLATISKAQRDQAWVEVCKKIKSALEHPR